MNRTEFMDLLRYYFRRVSPSELAEILSDYEAHFEEGKKAGLSEEEICRELGSPKAVYEMYLHEGMIHEQEETQAPGRAEQLAGQAEKLAGQAGRLAGQTLDRAQKAWSESGAPRLPGVLGSASDLLMKLLFCACYAAGFLLFVLTLFAVYFFSGILFPGLSWITLGFFTGFGVFASLALLFTGMEIRKAYLSRRTPPTSGTQEPHGGEPDEADEEEAEEDPEAPQKPEILPDDREKPAAPVLLIPAAAGRK